MVTPRKLSLKKNYLGMIEDQSFENVLPMTIKLITKVIANRKADRNDD